MGLAHEVPENKIVFSARKKEQDSAVYLPLEEQGLQAVWEKIAGDGSPRDPCRVKIRIRNRSERCFEGVILTERSL